MKKLSILCAALAMAALSFTSCQKEESYIANQQFIASFEQTGNDKVTIDDDFQMYWASDDVGNGNNSTIAVFAPGFETPNGHGYTEYYPTYISPDGKSAILEYTGWGNTTPFPADQQGPFYAISGLAIWPQYCQINADGTFHIGSWSPLFVIDHQIMPMVARADNFGELKFKHIFGILKIYINLPEGYDEEFFDATSTQAEDNPVSFYGCDVYWDANGDISMRNIQLGGYSGWGSGATLYKIKGNGFYYAPVFPGDLNNLHFTVNTRNANQRRVTFVKNMAEGATIHIERAGITTLTLNYTENDMIN